MVQHPHHVGQQFGSYKLLRLLGAGGFAEVYLGEHIDLGTQAAIKVLHTKLDPTDIDAFRTEARTIARLVHPHIIRVFDFNAAGTTPYLVMDYAAGGTTRQRYPKGTLLPLPTIISYVQQVADALQYAHEEKLIHRDIKPENILLDKHGNVLLSDFGIALVAQSSRYQSTQEIIGTAAYMSPEQIQGKPRQASDQYSLGVVIYEWLSGTRPFEGSLTELWSQHMFAPPPPLREKVPTISREIERVVMTALAKDPKQRFGNMRAFATALQQASRAGQEQTILSPRAKPEAVPGVPVPSSGRELPQAKEERHQAEEERARQNQEQAHKREERRERPTKKTALAPTERATEERARQNQEQAHKREQVRERSVKETALAKTERATTARQTVYPNPLLSSPTPRQKKRRRSPAVTISLILLTLILLGGVIFLIYQGVTGIHSGTSNKLSSVAWSGSQFVAVGDDGTILTSSDGHAWTARSASIPNTFNFGYTNTPSNLCGVAWSGSQFVAVGDDGTTLTSPDGSTWTTQSADNPSTSSHPCDVAWLGSQFVAVNGTIFTSPDGRTWTTQNSGASSSLNSVAWSGSQFVAVGDDGAISASPDGRTWTTQNAGTSSSLNSVAWSGSQFVAVGESGTILISSDGHTWRHQNAGTSSPLNSVVWSGSQFVAVGGTVLTSPDGRTWTTQNSGAWNNYLNGVVWSGSQFIAVGDNGTISASPDGRTWTS